MVHDDPENRAWHCVLLMIPIDDGDGRYRSRAAETASPAAAGRGLILDNSMEQILNGEVLHSRKPRLLTSSA